MAEQEQATGARTSLIYAKETSWGTVATTPVFQAIRLVGGESLDQNVAMFSSAEIRDDRMMNGDLYGTQRPGGSLPFELSPQGWNWMLWHLLGGTPTTTGASAPYTHVLKGSVDIPEGFTIEKQFGDLGSGLKKYWAWLGCRVDGAAFNFNIDQVVGGSVDIMARQMSTPATDSLNTGSAPVRATQDPYTAVQAVITEGGTELAIVTSCSLTVRNNLDTRYRIGSDLAISMSPRTRFTSGTLSVVFANTALYEKAVAHTGSSLSIVCTSGASSVTFLMPNIEFNLNGSVPKVNDDGGIELSFNFKAQKDDVEGTDIKVTIITPEAVISA